MEVKVLATVQMDIQAVEALELWLLLGSHLSAALRRLPIGIVVRNHDIRI